MRTPAKITAIQQRVLTAIERAAAAGLRCPTNAGIGETIGTDPKTVAVAMKELRARSLIVVETVHCSRRVTIAATGAQTAELPKPKPKLPSTDRAAQ